MNENFFLLVSFGTLLCGIFALLGLAAEWLLHHPQSWIARQLERIL